jgi:hypothetical protein
MLRCTYINALKASLSLCDAFIERTETKQLEIFCREAI